MLVIEVIYTVYVRKLSTIVIEVSVHVYCQVSQVKALLSLLQIEPG